MKKVFLLLPVGVLLSSCANELMVTEPSEIILVAGQLTVPSAWPEASTTATVNLSRVNSHGEDVTLSVTGMPHGLSAVFEKSTLSASETTAKLRLQAINVYPDVYTLTVSASSPSAKASTTLRVVVVGVDPINIPINTTRVSTVMGIPAGVQVSWVPAPGATGYRVDRKCGTDTYTELTKEVLPASTTTYSDGFVPETDTTCTYRVRTVLGEQISSGTESQPVRLLGVKIPDPATVTASLANNAVTVNWTAVEGAFSYWVERKCGSQEYQLLTNSPLANTLTTLTDNTPVAGTTCTYRVRVIMGNFISKGTESNPVVIP